MKTTFKKNCKYCEKIMEVETQGKETCWDCKVRMKKEYNARKNA